MTGNLFVILEEIRTFSSANTYILSQYESVTYCLFCVIFILCIAIVNLCYWCIWVYFWIIFCDYKLYSRILFLIWGMKRTPYISKLERPTKLTVSKLKSFSRFVPVLELKVQRLQMDLDGTDIKSTHVFFGSK